MCKKMDLPASYIVYFCTNYKILLTSSLIVKTLTIFHILTLTYKASIFSDVKQCLCCFFLSSTRGTQFHCLLLSTLTTVTDRDNVKIHFFSLIFYMYNTICYCNDKKFMIMGGHLQSHLFLRCGFMTDQELITHIVGC